jgi:hypothetical protein
MAIQATNKARFALEGFRVKRCNPDSTMATPSRTVGFVGTVDISAVLDAANEAGLGIKIGAAPWQQKAIDFSTADVRTTSYTIATLFGALLAMVTTSTPTETALTAMEAGTPSQFDIGQIDKELLDAVLIKGIDTSTTAILDLIAVLTIIRANTFDDTFRTELDAMITAPTDFTASTLTLTLATSSESVDPKVVTVGQAIGILATAAYSGILVGMDSYTRRLKLISISGDELQIKGAIAGAFDFGQGVKFGGYGVYYKKYFNDEAISCALPNDTVEKEEIDLEGAKGTITRLVIPAKRLGASPAIVAKFKDDELLQIIQGGTWTEGTTTAPGIYEPPASDLGGSPIFSLDVFAPLYADGSSLMSQVIGMDRRLFYACSGTEGDVPMEAKSWAQFAYNCTATEYIDETGKKYPSDIRYEYDASQFDALNVYDI